MAKAILLGSGTSNGVPMLGAKYRPGYLDNPKNHRNRSCLFLQGPTGNLLVDCPPELRLMCTGAGISEFAAVLITHTHADHIMGMDDLRSVTIKTGKPMTVYAMPVHQADIRRVFNYAFGEYPPGILVPRFDLLDVPHVIEVGGLQVRTFVVDHGTTPVVGLRVNDMAYITDVSRIPDEAMEMLEALDTLVVDAVRREPHPNHFHFEQAIAVAKLVGARMTYFTHLGSDYDHDVTNAELPSNIQLGYDGLEIPL